MFNLEQKLKQILDKEIKRHTPDKATEATKAAHRNFLIQYGKFRIVSRGGIAFICDVGNKDYLKNISGNNGFIDYDVKFSDKTNLTFTGSDWFSITDKVDHRGKSCFCEDGSNTIVYAIDLYLDDVGENKKVLSAMESKYIRSHNSVPKNFCGQVSLGGNGFIKKLDFLTMNAAVNLFIVSMRSGAR